MKKWLAMALALALLVGGTGALAEYEEHISITATMSIAALPSRTICTTIFAIHSTWISR